MIFGLVTSQLWKGGAIAGAVTSLALAGALGITVLQKNGIAKERDRLHDEIYAPVNGYIAKAARCKANSDALDAALQRQNKAMADLTADSEARLAKARQDLAAAQRDAATYRVQATRLAGATPTGVTQCDRILDVDAMIKEAFQ